MSETVPNFKDLEQELCKTYTTREARSDVLSGIVAAQVILHTYNKVGRELEAAEGIAKQALKYAGQTFQVACAAAIERTETTLYQYLYENRILEY